MRRVPLLASLRARLIAVFASGLAILLLATAGLALEVQKVGRAQQRITDGYLPLAKSVARLSTWQSRVDNDIRRLLTQRSRPPTGDRSLTDIFSKKLEGELDHALEQTTSLQERADSPAERAALSRLVTQFERIATRARDYQAEADRLMEAGEAGADDLDRTALLQLSTRLGDDVQSLAQQVDGRIAQLTTETERARQQAMLLAAGLFGVAVVVSGGVLVLVLVALGPIRRLTDQVQRLAAGDWSGPTLQVSGTGEIGLLATEFNTMVSALRERDRALVDRANELDQLSLHLGNVVDSLQEGLMLVENERITLVNPAAQASWDLAAEELPQPLSQLLEAGERGAEVRSADGRLYDVRLTPFAERGGLVTSSDITDATQAKGRLARSERLALIGQMLAQITHEVRNPLNALSLNAEMLGDEIQQLDPTEQTEGAEILGVITAEIERLTNVTGHYLQLARRPPAQLAPIDLPALVDDVIRLMAPDLEANGVELTVHKDAMERILADGNQLRRALLNVLRNAAEAGATQVDLTVSERAGRVHLVLSDNGPGMDDVERATDPFYSTKASGTGLGLAITRQILEDHDGTIEVRCPGSGTEVDLSFPMRSA